MCRIRTIDLAQNSVRTSRAPGRELQQASPVCLAQRTGHPRWQSSCEGDTAQPSVPPESENLLLSDRISSARSSRGDDADPPGKQSCVRNQRRRPQWLASVGSSIRAFSVSSPSVGSGTPSLTQPNPTKPSASSACCCSLVGRSSLRFLLREGLGRRQRDEGEERTSTSSLKREREEEEEKRKRERLQGRRARRPLLFFISVGAWSSGL